MMIANAEITFKLNLTLTTRGGVYLLFICVTTPTVVTAMNEYNECGKRVYLS